MEAHEVHVSYQQGMKFETDSPTGFKTFMDTSVKNGGTNEGLGPKAMMLSALAGCSGLDVVFVMNKMRAVVPHFEMKVRGELTEEHPKIYHKVWLDYHFYGKALNQEKINKAVTLSIKKYCGVMEMFRQFAILETKTHFHKK